MEIGIKVTTNESYYGLVILRETIKNKIGMFMDL